MSTRKKISLIGAGNIGGELAAGIARKELAHEVVLFDIPPKENFAKGKALDLEQCGMATGHDCRITGTSNWADCAGSDVIIITAGIPRKPGQDRRDLVATNLPIIRNVADNAKEHCPDAFVIVISNPLDAMVYEFKRPHRLCAQQGRWHGGCARQLALRAVPRPRSRGVGQGRTHHGARRTRRYHGADHIGMHGQRRERHRADLQGKTR